MRLLHAESHVLESFFEPDVPPYVTLSHRWEDDEVLFGDIGKPSWEHKKGFLKLHLVCQKALEASYKYVWIDTCCIDKSSSSELSEAINSMFRWYRNSRFCYAYLSDIMVTPEEQDITQSIWFNRGWTLQELIAPPQVYFYDRDGSYIGNRRQMAFQLSRKTRIQENMLSGYVEVEEALSEFTTAQKMSWAAGRKTTRTEDRAYSLLGIFGVNMPLLYGEGENAFVRLQEEILRTGTDLSLLSWSLIDDEWIHPDRGLLARSPDDFHGCDTIVQAFPTPGLVSEETSFAMTNKGLQIKNPPIVALPTSKENGNFALSLSCRKDSDICGVLALKIRLPNSTPVGEYFTKVKGRACYIGWSPDQVGHDIRLVRTVFFEPTFLSTWPVVTILRKQPDQQAGCPKMFAQPREYLWCLLPTTDTWTCWKIRGQWPCHLWDEQTLTCHLNSIPQGGSAAISLSSGLGESFTIRVKYLDSKNDLRFVITPDDLCFETPPYAYNEKNREYLYQQKEDRRDLSPTCHVKLSAQHLYRDSKTIFQLQIEVERPHNDDLHCNDPLCEADNTEVSRYRHARVITLIPQELELNEIGATRYLQNLEKPPTEPYDWRSHTCIVDYFKTVLISLGHPMDLTPFHGYAGLEEYRFESANEKFHRDQVVYNLWVRTFALREIRSRRRSDPENM